MQMMFKQAKFRMGYVDEVPMQVLELPYAGKEMCLVVLLPDDNTDLAVVRKPLPVGLRVRAGSRRSCLYVRRPDSF